MGVTVVTKKTQNVEDIDTTDFIAAEVVDTYAKNARKLAKLLAKLQPKINRLEKQEANLLKLVDENINAAVAITLVGNDYEVTTSAMGKKTELIDAEKARDLLTDEVFMKIAKVTLTDLKAYLTKDDYESIVKTTHKNKRRIKVEKL